MLHAIMEHSLRYRSEYMEVIALLIPSVIDVLPLNSLVKDKFPFSRTKLLVDVLSETIPIEECVSGSSQESINMLINDMMTFLHSNPIALKTLPKECYGMLFSILCAEVRPDVADVNETHTNHSFPAFFTEVWLNMLNICAYVDARDAMNTLKTLQLEQYSMVDNDIPVPRGLVIALALAKTDVLFEKNKIPSQYWPHMQAWCEESNTRKRPIILPEFV